MIFLLVPRNNDYFLFCFILLIKKLKFFCKHFYSSFDENLVSFESLHFASISNWSDFEALLSKDIYSIVTSLVLVYLVVQYPHLITADLSERCLKHGIYHIRADSGQHVVDSPGSSTVME